ncbi:eCIS core domain-containing protein [Streptomyces sp. NBC_00466]|uniref:eCIS core domain-containing protein n=1 Tax=unclassified Streptomyces TaxID=2593676 RepID=UPI00352D8FE6
MHERKQDVNAAQRQGSEQRRPAALQRPESRGAAAALAGQLSGGQSPEAVMALQRSVGNAAVAHMLEVQRHAHGASCGHQEAAPEEEAPVQRRMAAHDVLGTPGQPLPSDQLQDMEARFGGVDFSDVRIHDNAIAKKSAQEMGARAYTSGSHIVIGEGGGDSHTLAHELTHVVQQRQGPVAGTDNGNGLKVSDPSDRYEVAAEENARRVMSEAAPATEHTAQRAVTEEEDAAATA